MDPDDGTHHLLHAACNLMFLYWMDTQLDYYTRHYWKARIVDALGETEEAWSYLKEDWESTNFLNLLRMANS